MVVCKFFQQGNCRYGQNCRFDHIYGSKYSYHANQPVQSGVTDEQLITQVQSDVQNILRGGQWILSCYAPYKEKPNFPGLSDVSMEEIRLFFYECKATDKIGVAVGYTDGLFQNARKKYEELLQPNMSIIKTLQSIYRGEIVNTPFSNHTQSSNSATSIFRSAAQNTVFDQNKQSNVGFPPSSNVRFTPSSNAGFQQTAGNIFAQPSVFGQQQTNDTAKSIFNQANHSIFGQPSSNTNMVFEENSTAKSIFAQANQNVFQSAPPSFTSSPFAQQPTGTPFSNQTTPTFTNIFQMSDKQSCDNNNVYSDMKDISDTDMEAFNAADFRLGFIPELAPPRDVCF